MSETTDDPRREAGRKRGNSLRSKQIRALTAAALGASLLLGGAFLSVGKLHSTPSDPVDHPANPVTDDQSEAQVLDSAKEIVGLTGLHTASAGYTLMSCKDRDDPPYQGTIYLTFALPAAARADTYFPDLATTLVTHGWTEGLPPNDHVFARILSKDAVTVVVYRQSEDPSLGVARVYGQCRNVNDHRKDTTAWTDVTDRFPRPGSGP
ncbi:hypothetical protein [Mycobacterium sp.]|uniref:hypothetical protein n=1 Tax=Mycobacterium sp. TaxID=1785 RepID=UPI0025D7DE28|nr:hypothetical protein [Mycobacterium sp.]MBW0012997.1 hypothetical protein [Mycobacterium sp.]